MIHQKELTLIEVWNELNKVNIRIELIEKQIATAYDISASKIKDVMTQCSFSNTDKHLNMIIAKDERVIEWFDLRQAQIDYERIAHNELQRLKLTEPAICIAFLKEYYLKKDNKKMTWEEIAKEMGYSVRQCKRYYYEEYKGMTPLDNSWHNEEMTKNK